MTLLTIAGFIWTLFGPLVEAWLKSLFDHSTLQQQEAPALTRDGIIAYFATARARTWRVSFSRLRVNALERIALRHAPAIAAAMKFGAAPPVLSDEDVQELARSM